MRRTVILNVVGLTPALLGPGLPRISGFARRGAVASVAPVFPALTCSAQSTYLTGCPPSAHGIVGNGWYDRDVAEVQFWKQSNHLVQRPKIWEELHQLEPSFTCAKLFWWYNMYSSVDFSITPRPIYQANGGKVFDIYTWPYSIRPRIKQDLGDFPFATFWGPAAGRSSPQGPPEAASLWISASARWIEKEFRPTLSLVYLPHLDYNLQRLGPADPGVASDLRAIDSIVGDLIDFFSSEAVQVILLSEYGITPVHQPIHLNRLFRQQGWLAIKDELGLEVLDCGASRVFAVADHQVAHIYLNDPALEESVRKLLEQQPGLEQVLGRQDKARLGIDHHRAGDLVAVAAENAWFTYYYWLDDRLAPDFARTVDIHRKPGYDPVELFIDPRLRWPGLKIGWRLARKKLGFRALLDVIPLDATLVKGSHGRKPAQPAGYPLLISPDARLLRNDLISATDVYHVLRRHLLA